MTQEDLLHRITTKLALAGIPHMLTGSHASSAYGKGRATEDIDIIIDPTAAQLDELIRLLPPQDYYVSAEAAREALASRDMFNVIDLTTGWKIDLIVLKKSVPIEALKFHRRSPRSFGGVEIPVISPEDSILSKLEWRRDSRSERQYEDAVRVAVGKWDALDKDYLRHWATQLGLSEDLEQVLRDADALRPRE